MKHHADVQTVPLNQSRSVPQKPEASAGAGHPTHPGVQQRRHGHDAGSQAGWPQLDRPISRECRDSTPHRANFPADDGPSRQSDGTINRDRDIQVSPPCRSRSAQTTPLPARFVGPGNRGRGLPASVKANGHWLPIDILALGSSSANVNNNSSTLNRLSVTADSLSTSGDVISVANINGNKMLALSSKALSLLGTAIGLAPSVGQLSSDIKELIQNPGSEQAKWN